MPLPPSSAPSPFRPPADDPQVDGSSEPDDLRHEVASLRAQLTNARAQLSGQAEALERATHAAEAATDDRDRFISSVSHELRTPLSAILLWSSLIDEQQVDDPRLSEALGAIKRSAEEQSTLIDDIVDTSRLLANKLRLEPEPVHVAMVAQEALAAVAADARGKGLVVQQQIAAALPSIKADARRLRQGLLYLLRNAVKFTPTGGRVVLEVRASATPPELVFIVSDTGVGLGPEQLPELFTRVPRLNGKCARSEIGLGLGLLLANRIVRLHGGGLSAESPGPNHGATFTLRLPLAAAPSTVPAGAHRAAVLLTTSEVDVHEITARLRSSGMEPLIARSLEEVGTIARERPVDLIVASVAQPSDGALEAVARIRSGGVGTLSATIPAIALLLHEHPALLEAALEAGFQTALPLSADAGEWASTIGALVTSSPAGP